METVDTPRTIGKYEVLERIGEGAFGVVYKGRDPFTKGLVALRVCTSHDDTLRHRFLRQAEIAATLHHRNIVTVFELGADGAGPFLVQEYLGGEGLEAKIRRCDPIRPDVRLGYLLQLARALEYAHRKGILHRDLRPANVRVLEDDRIKVLDFGIARLSGAESELARSGRPPAGGGYLAPEQVAGGPVDARSDVFSFGVVAYELLTYVHPFGAAAAAAEPGRGAEPEPEPLAALWPECPPEIAALVGRCLERDPERRCPGFSEVAETLASVLAGLRQDAAPASEPAAAPVEVLSPIALMPVAAAAPDDGDATQEVPLPAGAPGAPRRRRPASVPARRLALAAGVILALGLLVLAAWVGMRRRAERGPGAAGETATAAAAPAGLGSTEGLLVMDAVPWGEVVRVTDGEGRAVPLPAEASTPLALAVPAGAYTAEISSPVSLESRTCRAEVAAAGTARCATDFYRLGALEYFQEAGWWR
ncbi:MAG TPA: serine/threonine-protein kinase [Thermoanaerobaculia bacterium]|nr:serine/threonine-protein kinase [Thermoanaerobaculia bacterium]